MTFGQLVVDVIELDYLAELGDPAAAEAAAREHLAGVPPQFIHWFTNK